MAEQKKQAVKEIVIIPVDANDKTILLSDLKIEEVDSHFRTVRELRGLEWKLAPGTYKVKMMLPSLKMKNFTLHVTPEESVYKLTVADMKGGKNRAAQRFPVAMPVSYRNDEGIWISTQSVNISTAGLCIVRKSSRLKAESLYVRLFLPISSIPLECPARICWTKEEGSQMGLELYLTPNMKSSLANWLSKCGG